MWVEVISRIITIIIIPLIFKLLEHLLGRFIPYIEQLIGVMKEKNDGTIKTTLITSALTQLDSILEKAVGANDALAEQYKKANEDGKLSPSEITELKETAKKLTYDMLPDTFSDEDFIKLIGGTSTLDGWIDNGIEAALIKFKALKK